MATETLSAWLQMHQQSGESENQTRQSSKNRWASLWRASRICLLCLGLYGILCMTLESPMGNDLIADSSSMTDAARIALHEFDEMTHVRSIDDGETRTRVLASDSLLRNESKFKSLLDYYEAVSASNHLESTLHLNEQYVSFIRSPFQSSESPRLESTALYGHPQKDCFVPSCIHLLCIRSHRRAMRANGYWT